MIDRLKAIRDRLGPLWWYSLLMFGFSRVGDLINLYIAMFLVPAVISKDRLGAVVPLIWLSSLVGVPLSIVVQGGLRYITKYEVAGERGKVKALLADISLVTGLLAAVVAAVLFSSHEFIQVRLKIMDPRVIVMVGAMAVVSCWTPVAQTTAQGLKRFYRLVAAQLAGPVARLIVVLLLLERLQIVGFLAGSVAFKVGVILTLGWGLWHYVGKDIRRESYRSDLPALVQYIKPIAVSGLVLTLQLAAEPWIIRQRLPETESAAYYILATFGNIPMYVAASVIPFLFPLVAERHERGQSTRRIHLQALAVVFLTGTVTALAFVFVGRPVLALREAWREYETYAPFLWQIGLVTTANVVVSCHTTHEIATRTFGYLRYVVPVILLELIVLQCLMGWPFFRPWLPAGLWGWVDGWIVRDLRFIVNFMLGARVLVLVGIVVELLGRRRETHG